MEIVLKLPEGEKTFTQKTVNFITITKALEWMERYTQAQKRMIELAQAGIEGEVIEDEDYDAFEPSEDLAFTADLVVSFFSGQFTYDEFARYAYFENVGEFYNLAYQIWDLAFEQKKEGEAKNKGKKRKPTS